MTIRTISTKALAISNFIESNVDSIFVITASIDLEGSTVKMPANSKLVFKSGGKLYNGVFRGQKAMNDYLDIQWFSQSSEANVNSLEAAIAWNNNILVSCTCTLNSEYTIYDSGIRIFGLHPDVSVIQSPANSNIVTNLIHLAPEISYITIENITLRGYVPQSSSSDLRKTTASYLLKAFGKNTYITLKGCVFESATGGVFILPNSRHITIEGCVFRKMVFVVSQGSGGYGVVFHENDDGKGSDHIIIRNCIFEKTVIRHAFYLQSSNDVLIENNIIYGTTQFNNSTLVDKFYQHAINPSAPALTATEIASIDVEKHMTKFDSAISNRGCANIRITNNCFQDGLIILNGSNGAPSNTVKGRFFLLKENVIKNYCIPNYNTHPALYNWDSIDDYRLVNNNEINITYFS